MLKTKDNPNQDLEIFRFSTNRNAYCNCTVFAETYFNSSTKTCLCVCALFSLECVTVAFSQHKYESVNSISYSIHVI